MPIPESERSSVPMRVPRDALPFLDRIAAALREDTGGGEFSRGVVVRIAARAWLHREGLLRPEEE